MGDTVEQLQRSVTSFRRQGSSGSVWDDKFLAGLWDQTQNQNQSENKQGDNNERDEQGQSQSQPQSESSGITLERSRSEGGGRGEGGRQHHHRTVNVAPPSIDPPSPKVSTCGLCGFFAKPSSSSTSGTRKFNNTNGKVKKRR
ncbi:hypothetical protein PIB30_004918 [Stylosanthes scabra]|uniref:MAPK kinase substrate protein n=1 Tax=Stylosanthes scabra TaxID=79078 RepID=A0ABU6W4J3_9FABA|nr:hypothetical protein [Stylosanthes scabra]